MENCPGTTSLELPITSTLVSCNLSVFLFHRVTKSKCNVMSNSDLKPAANMCPSSATAELGCRARRVGRDGASACETRREAGIGCWNGSQFEPMAGLPLERTVSQSSSAAAAA